MFLPGRLSDFVYYRIVLRLPKECLKYTPCLPCFNDKKCQRKNKKNPAIKSKKDINQSKNCKEIYILILDPADRD